jgi:hypothetical protein
LDDPVSLKGGEVSADGVIREAKGLSELLDGVAGTAQQHYDAPARAREKLLIPACRRQSSPSALWR